MRIILSFFDPIHKPGDAAAVSCFYESFILGLKEEGHDIICVSTDRWNARVGILPNYHERILSFNPDLIIAFDNNGPDWSSLFDCPIVVYDVTSPLRYAAQGRLLQNPNHALYFVAQPVCRKILKWHYCVDDSRIFKTSPFTQVVAERQDKSSNIAFIGGRLIGMKQFPWSEFQKASHSDEERDAFRRLMAVAAKDPFLSDLRFADACRELGIKVPHGGLPLMVEALSAEKRIRVLAAVSDLGLDLYGTAGWGSRGGENALLTMAYHAGQVFSLQQNQDVYNRARIGINVNHLAAVDGFSMRVCDVMASDCCLVTEYSPALKRVFPELDLPTFTNPNEARERCQYLLDNPSYREELVARCHLAIDEHARFDQVLRCFKAAGIDLFRKDLAEEGHVEFMRANPKPVMPQYPQPQPPPDPMSKGERPLVSMFVPTYNQEQFVSETLEGLFSQDYENLEIVISDDHSTDATWQIIKKCVHEYRRQGGPHKIILNRNDPNLGIIGNIEKALSLTHGELVVANGGDDISVSNRISRIVDVWEKNGRKDYCIIHGFDSIGACSQAVSTKLPYVPNKTTPMGAVMAYRREVFDKFDRVRYANMSEDHLLVRRAIMLGEVRCIPDRLVKYRRGVGVSTVVSYHERRKGICRLGIFAAMQTLREVDLAPCCDEAHREEARKIAVFCLNFYSREYFSYGLPMSLGERFWIFRTLNRADPLRILSTRFICKRMSCVYPYLINVQGRWVSHCLKDLSKWASRVVKGIGNYAREQVRKQTEKNTKFRAWAKKAIKPTLDRLWIAYYTRRCRHALTKLRKRVKAGGVPVRVAFLQLFPASNQNFSVFDCMRRDPNFEPFIIVYPDHLRSKQYAKENYKKTLASMISRFGSDRVLPGLDEAGKQIDYTDKFDLMTTSNPYEGQAPEKFTVGWWTKRAVPSFYLSYFYMGRCYVTPWNLRMRSLSCFWRIYAENAAVVNLAKQHQIVKGRNIVHMGCAKMDAYAQCVRQTGTEARKRILIAPHHGIAPNAVSAGAFAEYANDFLKLLKEFPQVDFVFRPHPLLFQKLRGLEKVPGFKPWGGKKVDAYLASLRRQPNLIMSPGGDYFQEFADSDALIHDCGSFQAEYLFTGKPCGYIHRKIVSLSQLFLPFGLQCVNMHYGLFSPQDVRRFVKNVVIGGHDPKRAARQAFASRELMHNYPHASERIVEDIKHVLGIQ